MDQLPSSGQPDTVRELIRKDGTVREKLRPKEDRKEFELTGNALEVKGALANVDELQKDGHGGFQLDGNAILFNPVPQNVAYLKETIQKKKPNRVTCDADALTCTARRRMWTGCRKTKKPKSITAKLRQIATGSCCH